MKSLEEKNPIFKKILQSAVEGAAGSEIDRIKTNINRKQKNTIFLALNSKTKRKKGDNNRGLL